MKILKIAQDKLPFNIYRIEGGKPDVRITKNLHPVIFYAFSAEQARVLAFQKYPQLEGYIKGCRDRRQECDIVARLDKEKIEEIKNYTRVKKEMEDKYVQEAWWNKL